MPQPSLHLRQYQKEDVLKLAKLKCSACLNEQRTGKTPTALMIMRVQRHKKILIVCPGVATYSWKTQFEAWLQRPCIVLDGTPTQRKEKLKQWTDGLVITFDTLKILNHYTKETKHLPKKEREIDHQTGELSNILKQHAEAVIVDEFHRARNPKTYTAKALFKLIPVIPYRVALTGTPAYSKNIDIWTLLHFLYPAKFPSYWKFLEEYFEIPLKWTPNGMARDIKNAVMRPEKQNQLQAFLNLIATQRKQHDPDVMPWLPDKPIPIKVKLPPTKEQQQHLDMLMRYFETDSIICKQPIDRLVRYRQICQDPRLLNLKGGSAKTNWLDMFYKDYAEQPTIIFSTFTSYLKLLSDSCPYPYALITGETSNEERKIIETKFQNGEINYVFANIKAAKENLTLDRAEHKIFLDKYPPLGDILQASERFTATQESRKDIPKKIWELMLANTFDEQIYTALEESKTETDILNNFKNYLK